MLGWGFEGAAIVECSRLSGSGPGFGVQGVGCRMQDVGCVSTLFRVHGSGCSTQRPELWTEYVTPSPHCWQRRASRSARDMPFLGRSTSDQRASKRPPARGAIVAPTRPRGYCGCLHPQAGRALSTEVRWCAGAGRGRGADGLGETIRFLLSASIPFFFVTHGRHSHRWTIFY